MAYSSNSASSQLTFLRRWLPVSQYAALLHTIAEPEGSQELFPVFQDAIDRIELAPVTYEKERVSDPVVYFHYFLGGCDAWIYELDKGSDDDSPEDWQRQAFGYVDLGYGAEAGYVSIPELIQSGMEFDLYWTPKHWSRCRR